MSTLVEAQKKIRTRNFFLFHKQGRLQAVSQILSILYCTPIPANLETLTQEPHTGEGNMIRVLTRTGFLDILNIDSAESDHRLILKEMVKLVPQKTAMSIFTPLSFHGKEVCKNDSPLCNRCEIRKFCKTYRCEIKQKDRGPKFSVVDLFCGAGGVSLGFHDEGFKILLAVDWDFASANTFILNHPWFEENKFIIDDITTKETKNKIVKEIGGQRVDVLVAGVPCQGFSTVGYKTKPKLRKKNKPEEDPRNRHFLDVIEIAGKLKPKFVLIENVPDMKNTEIYYSDRNLDGNVIDLLKIEFRKIGYASDTLLLKSSLFGIPQKRKRLFFIAIEGKEFPERLKEKLEDTAKEMGCFNIDIDLKEAIGDLPVLDIKDGKNITEITASGNQNISPYSTYVKDSEKILFNHVSRFHNEDDLKIITELKPGEKYSDLLDRCPDILNDRKHAKYGRDSFKDKFYRLSYTKQSRTIVAHLAKDGNSFIHSVQNRSISVREAARIQAFPDSYVFTGARTHQFIQIGNAVPPLLAKIIAKLFRVLLSEDQGSKKSII